MDDLWKLAPAAEQAFRPDALGGIPEAARAYLEHAIRPGTPLAGAVRLRMRGEIKLRGWLPFTADEVIRWDRGFVWSASVRMKGLPIRGSDRLEDGGGAMRWKLLGLIPVMAASGPDLSRSAIGRMAAESIWLPSALCGERVGWSAPDEQHPHARFDLFGEAVDLGFDVEATGRLAAVRMLRWGNPEGGAFAYTSFGGVMEDERAFAGFTIPARIRVGWYYGTDRFEREGEFFRATVEDATFR